MSPSEPLPLDSPSALPAPPMRWTAGPAGGPLPTLARSTQPSEDAPAQQLQRSDFVVRQLQGNLLHREEG